MDLKAALYAYITGKSAFGNLCVDRLYPEYASQNVTLPYVVMEIEDSNHPDHLRGGSAMTEDVVTFTIYAVTSESRQSVREAMRNILHGRQHVSITVADTPSYSLELIDCRLDATHESYLPPTDGTEIGRFVLEMDFKITWVEAAPTLP